MGVRRGSAKRDASRGVVVGRAAAVRDVVAEEPIGVAAAGGRLAGGGFKQAVEMAGRAASITAHALPCLSRERRVAGSTTYYQSFGT